MKANATEILEKLDELRTELIELAYTLDTRGQLAAADVAMTTSARIRELCEEFARERSDGPPPALETADTGMADEAAKTHGNGCNRRRPAAVPCSPLIGRLQLR